LQFVGEFVWLFIYLNKVFYIAKLYGRLVRGNKLRKKLDKKQLFRIDFKNRNEDIFFDVDNTFFTNKKVNLHFQRKFSKGVFRV